MTRLNTTVFAFAAVLSTSVLGISATPLFGQSGTTPIAPSMQGIPSVLQSDDSVVDAVTGDYSNEREDLSLDNETVGEDFFEEDGDVSYDAVDSPSKNRVFGIGGLALSRGNFNDSQSFDGGLSSGQVTLEDRGGLDLYMTTRNSEGRGWGVRYFGLFEDNASVSETFFPIGATASLSRTGDIHNVELNYLRQAEGPLTHLGLSLNEVIIGVRYFQFNDALRFNSNFSSSFAQEAENSLFGLQLGRRLEKQFGYGFGLTGFGKLGVYTNRVDSSFALEGGSTSRDSKDDVAFLGELDIALTYAFKPNVRAKLGYRMLAATELGIADRQTSGSGSSAHSADSNGDIFLDGGYLGIEIVR